ncbi:hypothetical protein [uncultured Caulobacter sp.]|uniref:hypothetical protein n=1 Tax=uncultured Caulobacter sp. TaxID=158749 RepID=UPI0026272E6E|nr:hypothetical protein [uncultured Caulobacter sp.]
MNRLAASVLMAVALIATGARADEFVRADCRNVVAPSASLHYDSPEHALWYRRFWTGSCEHLPLLCLPGSPNWNEIVGKLLARGGPDERQALLPKACRLGQLIGLEWSRDKKVKHITTGDLRTFNSLLDASGDALRGVDQVDAKARAMTTPR